MKTWLIYIRKSVVRDDTDLESPERQLHVSRLRLALLTEPYQEEIYQDLDRSGSSEGGRPAWLELKEQLNRPEVAGVVASSLDRLYRNVSEFLEFLNLLEQSGKTLITAKENLDTGGPLGRFVVTILMALFEMEWRLTSTRMTEMIAYKRREQGRHWGPAPFGTERDNAGQLTPSTLTTSDGRHYFDALAEMYRLFATGAYSYESLANALNTAGWQYLDRHHAPQPFTKEHVREILARWRLYQGNLPLGNSRKTSKLEWLNGGHAPLLPVELCDAVGVQLAGRNRPYKARTTTRIYLLSGLLHCDQCGSKLGGQKHGEVYYYRHAETKNTCPEKWVQASLLESQALNAIIEFAVHPGLMAGIRTKAQTITTPAPSPDDQSPALREKLNRLEDIYIDGLIERDAYLTKRGRILSNLATLELTHRPAVDLPYLDNINASLHLIGAATPATQRDLVSSLFSRLTTSGREIKTATPQPWAQPFFTLCEKWAGWGRNPQPTKPVLLDWLVSSPIGG